MVAKQGLQTANSELQSTVERGGVPCKDRRGGGGDVLVLRPTLSQKKVDGALMALPLPRHRTPDESLRWVPVALSRYPTKHLQVILAPCTDSEAPPAPTISVLSAGTRSQRDIGDAVGAAVGARVGFRVGVCDL